MAEELRVGFVTGATPDKWARAWRERRPEPLTLVPVTEEEQEAVVRRDEVDLCLVRLPVDTDDLHNLVGLPPGRETGQANILKTIGDIA